MNILEFKIHLEDSLIAIKELKNEYDIKGYDISALVNNNVSKEAPGMALQEKANLVFESIETGKLPTGGHFVVFNLKENVGHSTPWEPVIKQIDDVMDKIPLNAIVTFKVNREIAFLTSMAGEIVLADEKHYGRLFMQFMTRECELFEIAVMKFMKELDIKL